MTAPDFTSILSQSVESIERPSLPPVGTYEFTIPSIPKMDTRGTFDIIDFQLKAVGAPEVDPDLLREYGAVSSVTTRYSFMFDKEDAARFQQTHFRLKTFLEKHLGIDPALSLKEALNASVNKRFLGELGYRADKTDPSIQYVEVRKTAPLE